MKLLLKAPSYASVGHEFVMSKKAEKWLLVNWGCGGHDVVNIKSVITPSSEALVGTVVIADKGNGSHEAATVLGISHNKHILMMKAEKDPEEQTGNGSNNEEGQDFSSGSSWAPSDDNDSSDAGEMKKKKMKMSHSLPEQITKRTGRVMKPSHRADAINHIIAKKLQRREETNTSKKYSRKGQPDSTKKPQTSSDNLVSINIKEIVEMKECFKELFQMLRELKASHRLPITSQTVECNFNNTENSTRGYESPGSDRGSDDFNRSDDNILITNKSNRKVLGAKDTNKTKNSEEWVPIGSGKTLIHKDKFNKVKWKSYTVATRSLLLAAFPRRVLATHSLTGKRSPAFQDKPAKMCLDPKIVSDIVIEITERFNIKEGLVRSIITTKCADECKMYKMRMSRKSLDTRHRKRMLADDDVNQTC